MKDFLGGLLRYLGIAILIVFGVAICIFGLIGWL